MTILIWCLFITGLLPLVAKGPVAIAMSKLGGYNNNHPRDQQSKLTGFGARALAAHQNSFESFIIFAPAILLAIATNHTGDKIELLAMLHVTLRAVYIIFYLINFDKLRSLVWFASTFCSFSIMIQCIP